MTFLYVIDTAFNVMSWLIIIRVLLSWIPHDPYNAIFRFIYEITEIVLAPARKIVPAIGGLDFSPIVAIIVLDWLIRPLVFALLQPLF